MFAYFLLLVRKYSSLFLIQPAGSLLVLQVPDSSWFNVRDSVRVMIKVMVAG